MTCDCSASHNKQWVENVADLVVQVAAAEVDLDHLVIVDIHIIVTAIIIPPPRKIVLVVVAADLAIM